MTKMSVCSNLPSAFVFAAFLALVPWAQAAVEEEIIEQSFEVGSSPELILDGFNGSIVIEGGSSDIEVRATKYVHSLTGIGARDHLKEIRLEMKQEGDRVEIVARGPEGVNWFKSAGVKFELEVPSKTIVNARTTNGKIIVEDLEAPAKLRTTNGSIVAEIEGDLDADTTNGAIKAEFNASRVKASTTNGSITLEGVADEIETGTTNGRIQIETGDRPAKVTARSTNGSICFEGPLAGNNEFRTTNGSVTIHLPSHTAFAIDASTSNGRICNDFEMSDIQVSKKKQLVASRGRNPEAKIRVRTSNSSINIGEN